MRTLLAAIIAFAALFGASHVSAQTVTYTTPAPLAASTYSASLEVTTRMEYSNVDWTCTWAINCDDGTPDFHSDTGDNLQRVSGWAQTAMSRTDRKHPHRSYGYLYFASTFQGVIADLPANAYAFTDFNGVANLLYNFTDASGTPAWLIAGGKASSLKARADTTYGWLGAYWIGPSLEVEGGAFCDSCSKTFRKQVHAQFLAGMTALAAETTPSP